MQITVDMGITGFTLFLASIARWDDDAEHSIAPEKAQEIANNIRRALASQGHDVVLEP